MFPLKDLHPGGGQDESVGAVYVRVSALHVCVDLCGWPCI